MGVILSYVKGTSNEPDPVTGLTPKEKSLVTSTWALVSKDLLGNGIELFMILFKRKPEYQQLFSFRDVPYEELPKNASLKGHATRVMYALSSIVDNLDNGEVLVDLLNNTAQSHTKRNIPEESFKVVHQSVLELLQKGLGSKINKEGLDAWDKTLTVAMKVITDRYREIEKA